MPERTDFSLFHDKTYEQDENVEVFLGKVYVIYDDRTYVYNLDGMPDSVNEFIDWASTTFDGELVGSYPLWLVVPNS